MLAMWGWFILSASAPSECGSTVLTGQNRAYTLGLAVMSAKIAAGTRPLVRADHEADDGSVGAQRQEERPVELFTSVAAPLGMGSGG